MNSDKDDYAVIPAIAADSSKTDISPESIEQAATTKAKLKRRYATHLSGETWQMLKYLSAELDINMSNLIAFFVNERTIDQLRCALKLKPTFKARLGRPKQSFHNRE